MTDERKFRYFVSFVVSNYPKDHFNCGEITLDGPISSMDDIKEIESKIKAPYGGEFVEVSILSWQRFENPLFADYEKEE